VSQYPPQSPYQFPQPPPMGYAGPYGYDPGAMDPLAKCRRASVLMFVFGGLLLLLGGCAAGVMNIPGMEAAIASQPGGGLPPDTTFEQFRRQMTVTGGVMVGLGLLGIVLGAFVRGGSRGATIGALVLAFLVAIYGALNFLGALALGARGAGAQALMGACLSVFVIGLTVWLIVWLFQAMGAAGRAANAGAWQGQGYAAPQHQSMYGQPGYPPYPQQQQQQWGPPPPPPPPGQWPPPQQQQPNWHQPPPPPSSEPSQQHQQQQQNWPPPPPPANPG
jgi:hypothetical protein